MLGQEFILQTDHKPLVGIFGESKGLPDMAAARMQSWAFILSGFNYKIEYINGKNNFADGFSRMPQIQQIAQFTDINYINFVERENPLMLSFKNIAITTRRDPILSKLANAIQMGKVSELSDKFRHFKSKDQELSVEQDCVLWGYRTIIPLKLRNNVLVELHRSHLGIVKTKALAPSYVWWPDLEKNEL